MDRACSSALCGITVPGVPRARVSAYADDVSAFVSSRSDIEVVLKALERYKLVIGDKINCDTSSVLRLSAWKRVDLPESFG